MNPSPKINFPFYRIKHTVPKKKTKSEEKEKEKEPSATKTLLR